jgi:hypothetical protein
VWLVVAESWSDGCLGDWFHNRVFGERPAISGPPPSGPHVDGRCARMGIAHEPGSWDRPSDICGAKRKLLAYGIPEGSVVTALPRKGRAYLSTYLDMVPRGLRLWFL